MSGEFTRVNKFTFDELRAEAERELVMRRHVYRRMADPNEPMPDTLQRRIDLMEAIAAHFRELAKQEELPL